MLRLGKKFEKYQDYKLQLFSILEFNKSTNL